MECINLARHHQLACDLDLGGIAGCIALSACFAGLNLAVFSISQLRLQLEADGGNVDAAGVLALRKNSNQVCWHRPLVVRDMQTRLGDVVGSLKVLQEQPGDEVIDNDLILVWGTQRRIITGSDLLGRLLRGIASIERRPPVPGVEQRASAWNKRREPTEQQGREVLVGHALPRIPFGLCVPRSRQGSYRGLVV